MGMRWPCGNGLLVAAVVATGCGGDKTSAPSATKSAAADAAPAPAPLAVESLASTLKTWRASWMASPARADLGQLRTTLSSSAEAVASVPGAKALVGQLGAAFAAMDKIEAAVADERWPDVLPAALEGTRIALAISSEAHQRAQKVLDQALKSLERGGNPDRAQLLTSQAGVYNALAGGATALLGEFESVLGAEIKHGDAATRLSIFDAMVVMRPTFEELGSAWDGMLQALIDHEADADVKAKMTASLAAERDERAKKKPTKKGANAGKKSRKADLDSPF